MNESPAYSRRHFLRTLSMIAVAQTASNSARVLGQGSDSGKTLAYIGTYTGAVGAGSNGEGIYSVRMDAATGELTHCRLAAKSTNPSWIAIHPSGRYLYAVNEIDSYRGSNATAEKSGSVSAFAIDHSSGDLTPLNIVSSEGAGPAYISIDTSGKFAFVANYGAGSVAVLPINSNGSLGLAVDMHRDSGSLGTQKATNGPPGSFAVSGHDAPHAHMILPDPSNSFVLVADLGQDRLYSYKFDPTRGKLTAASDPYAQLSSGDGPRHFAYHPNRRWLYSIQEESSTLEFFHYDAATGKLQPQQSISALPPGFAGTSFASEVLISPDGKFLYAANRLHDGISVFSITESGILRFAGESSTLGDYPGQLRIEPGENFLYACNRKSDNITSFRIDRQTGLLKSTGSYTGIGSPASITFMPIA